jgi:L-lactate dehydrogenase (cytochrome)
MSAPANEIPMLENCLNLQDIEQAAVKLLGNKAYAYYASAGDDEKTKRWNTEAFDLIRFRPRLLRNVKLVDTSINLLGFSSALPFFISPAALAGLAHKDGKRLEPSNI